MQQLRLSSLHLAGGPASLPAGSGTVGADSGAQRLLSAQLQWQSSAGASPRCCHVWRRFLGGGGNNGSGGISEQAAALRWLGAACCGSYCIASLPVPAGATAVQFVVQPETGNGLVQDLREAAYVEASLAQHSSG